jgi:hypothetical protein
VVTLLLGLFAYPVGEGQRLGKVTKPEHALESFGASPLHYFPPGNLRVQFFDLGVG